MLVLARKCGESLIIGDDIEITITEISGDKVKLGINAPKSVQILRKELVQTIEANKVAASDVSSDALRKLALNLKHVE